MFYKRRQHHFPQWILKPPHEWNRVGFAAEALVEPGDILVFGAVEVEDEVGFCMVADVSVEQEEHRLAG